MFFVCFLVDSHVKKQRIQSRHSLLYHNSLMNRIHCECMGVCKIPSNENMINLVPTWKPLFATPSCNTSRATWSTPSEPPPRKPFFEVLSFSALFGTGCCCQLVCFEFGVLHFRLPLYTRNGQVGEHVLLLWFLALVLAGCCCQLVCFEFVVLHFRLPIPETGRL